MAEPEAEARTIKLTLQYDGTDFSGWQAQPGRRTVQGVLAAAIARVLRAPAEGLTGAGRTDAGVHALGQVASFVTSRAAVAPSRLVRALNGVLPEDVSVSSAEEVPAGFSARFSARAKWYRYRIWDAPAPNALERRTSHHVHQGPLDEAAMRAAASVLVGTHDFRSFWREAIPSASAVRTVFSLDVSRAASILTLDVTGDGFLYAMVRAIAGTLVDVGRGKTSPADVDAILSARDRGAAGPTLPPRGLFLMRVDYDD